MKLCRLVLPALLALLAIPSSPAQDPQPRLRGAIRDGALVPLANSRPPLTLHAQDLGPVPDATPVPGITLVFRRSAAQQADLETLLADQQNPASPTFHHWLTPEAFGQRFGMADADLALTKDWLAAQGFTVIGLSRAHDRLTFSGTAAQVRTAFGAALHRYQIDNQPHLAPAADLSLPSDLAAITTAILHLSDLRPKPQVKSLPRPAFTALSTEAHLLTPKDLAILYDTGSTFTGTGHSIAVVGQSFVNISDFSSVRTFQVLATTANLPFSVLVPGTGVEAIFPGDAGESDIDLEYASGMAPAANVFLVYTGSSPNFGVFDALTYAIDQNLAEVISISYGQCETFLSATDLQQGNAILEQAAAQGQTIVAASGDSGSTACADYPTSGRFTAAEQQALTVNYPASSPLVTAVGGTQMAASAFAAGPNPFWALALNSDLIPSLLSYAPEIAWNEGSVDFGILAGGGGASSAFPRPVWQTQFPGLPAGNTRLLPDIALQASIESPGFLLCTDDASFLASEGQTFSCGDGLRGSNNQYTTGGGTSFAAPTFAGMVARLNQQQASAGQGPLNPLLYRLAASTPSVFHDITTGSIACIPGSAPACAAPGQSGFAAVPGFDEATGLGSLGLGNLLNALPAPPASSLQPTFLLLNSPSLTAAIGGSDLVQISISSLGNPRTAPTGTVAIAVDGVVTNPALTLAPDSNGSDATASYTFIAPAVAGSHLVTATYAGDAAHAPSSATYPILVGNVIATGSITFTVGSVTLPASGSTTSPVLVIPSGGYNGELVWSLAFVSSNGANLTACYDIAPIAIQGNTSTTLSLGTGAACSAPLPSARPAARPLSIRAAQSTPGSAPWRAATTATLSALLLCGLLPKARRRSLALLCLLPLLAVSLTALSGCGGSGAPAATTPPPAAPIPAVTYTLALTGADSVNGVIQSSANFTLTVQ